MTELVGAVTAQSAEREGSPGILRNMEIQARNA
jgi:hypothetical protein